MAVTRFRASRRPTRRNVKARRPWSRTVRSMANDSSFRSVIPRIRNPDYGYPDKLVTKLRYVDSFNLTGSTNTVGANVYRMNSLFDPDLTGVGHQPMYYDQFCGAVGTAPYSRYRVLSSVMTVTYTPVSLSTPGVTVYGPFVIGLAASGSSGLYATDVSGLCEASNSTWTYLGEKTGGNNVKTLKCTYNPSRDLGLDTGDDTIAAQYNANPQNVFHAIPWKIDTNSQGGNVSVLVSIEYRVEFYTRNEVSKS